jgi:hypothetical protein
MVSNALRRAAEAATSTRRWAIQRMAVAAAAASKLPTMRGMTRSRRIIEVRRGRRRRFYETLPWSSVWPVGAAQVTVGTGLLLLVGRNLGP